MATRTAEHQQESRAQLQLFFDAEGLLVRTEFSCSQNDDDRCANRPLTARSPDDFALTKRPIALCAVIIRGLICAWPERAAKSVPALEDQREAVFSLIKNIRTGAPGWVEAIFGSDANGCPLLPLVMANKGSGRNASSHLRTTADVIVWKDDTDITQDPDALSRLLSEITDDDAIKPPAPLPTDYEIRTGYYVPEFISMVCRQSKKSLWFVVHRNIAISDTFTLDNLRGAAERGVAIRILALSSKAPSHVLTEAVLGLPRPVPLCGDALSCQLEHGEGLVGNFARGLNGRLEYRGYHRLPIQHFVIADDRVHAGFCNFDLQAQQKYFRDRWYLTIGRQTSLGRQYEAQFDVMWRDATPLDLAEPA